MKKAIPSLISLSLISVILIAVTAIFNTSCSGSGSFTHADGDTIRMKYAKNIVMTDHGNYIAATFRNPWDTTHTLQRYILVHRDSVLPTDLPNGLVIRVPLQRSVVYTSAHSSLIDELGATDAIVGVCDAEYIIKPSVSNRISSGAITDCGKTMTPNIEKIILLGPDALLLSAFENSSDHNKVDQIGIPIIDCTDYMEPSPLGRAEWMRFYGYLFGVESKADSLFSIVEKNYLATKEAASNVETRPSVIVDQCYGGVWSVPGATSTTGIMIEDAGGHNPFDDYKKSGGVQLAPEEVLFKASDADIWMIRYYMDLPLTLSQLSSDNPLYSRFRPFKDGEVYGCNTLKTTFFDDSAFHPDWILAEYMRLLHPEIPAVAEHPHYFEKLSE